MGDDGTLIRPPNQFREGLLKYHNNPHVTQSKHLTVSSYKSELSQLEPEPLSQEAGLLC